MLAAPSSAPLITAATAALLGLLINVAAVVLVVWALVTILKLPGLLERQASLQNQTHQVLREILQEIRSVTRQ